MQVDKRVLGQGCPQDSSLPAECHSQGTMKMCSSRLRETQRSGCFLFLQGLCAEGDVCLARSIAHRGTLALDYERRTCLLPELRDCAFLWNVLPLSCLVTWYTGHSAVCWTISIDVCVCSGEESRYGSWLEICKIWGQQVEVQRGNPIRIAGWMCVTEQVGSGAGFGYIPLFLRHASCAHECPWKYILLLMSVQQLGSVPVCCQPVVCSILSG